MPGREARYLAATAGINPFATDMILGDDDLASLFLADLSHAADADAQVIQHALRNGHKFLARCSDGNASCAAIE